MRVRACRCRRARRPKLPECQLTPATMKTAIPLFFFRLAAVSALAWFCTAPVPIAAADTLMPLWQIGRADKNNAEFALAPKNYQGYREDGFFIVGRSDPKEAWPYVHPGPVDSWAGGRTHTFAIVFGVKQAAPDGTCQLVFDLLDTQGQTPPKLRVEVNGSPFERQLPAGAGDASVEGQPAKGKAQHFAVEFPASLLKAGNNEIVIANVAGSWMLYDRVALETPAGVESAPIGSAVSLRSVEAQPALVEREGRLYQPVTASLVYVGETRGASVRLGEAEVSRVQLKEGTQRLEVLVPSVEKETEVTLQLVAEGKTLASQAVKLKPVRKWVVYVLMHSHNDVGYTDIQPNIAKRQAQNVVRALELIRETKDYPAAARFKWNLEVLLPAEDFYATATADQKREFEKAITDGDIGVDAMYGNLLTGVCRSEELLRQFSFATALGRRCGVTVDSMMISDVPGLTWGTVPALAQNGVKYISNGPNASRSMDGDRIGYVRVEWEHKPFYWLSPSGNEKALYWGAQGGYSLGHHFPSISQALPFLLQRLDEEQYPYDIVQLRWTKGDNGPPDEGVMSAVRDWNATHAFPKLIIATMSEAFHAFENRYGAKLPTFSGDFTPYWEDGAASGARETGLNRHSADRLLEAETLWAMSNPGQFPADDFAAAWKNVVLWSEHTWGAYNSVSEPDKQFVKDQWKFKQAYALDADTQSRNLLTRALAARGAAVDDAVDVFNTASWPRTDLVTLPKGTKGDRVNDDGGQPVPSQRLSTGELVFLARDIPPFGSKRFVVEAGTPPGGGARVEAATLSTSSLTVILDPTSGAIVSLRKAGLDAELSNAQLNTYVYLPGGNVKDARPNGRAKISIKESGPLVVSLLVESDAPGCNKLSREVRLVDGLDRVELINLLDKKAVRAVEGVHFGFGFNIPNPEVRVNSPWAVVKPEKDQIAGSCKNWFSVERWVDISNDKYGVTWSTSDAPLMEVGGLTANLPRSQPNPDAFLKTIEPSATIYSWAMNNHWHTNYRADQEGPTWFQFALRPHAEYDPIASARFGVESTQPLIVAPAAGTAPVPSRLRIEPAGVIATAFKPSDDGKGLIVRLFGASGKAEQAKLVWATTPKRVSLSDGSELLLSPVADVVSVPAWGVVTLRAEME